MNGERLRPYFMLAPVMLVQAWLIFTGIYTALEQSLGHFPAAGLNGYSLKFYIAVLKNPDFLRSLVFSFYVAFVSSALAVILGIFLAVLLIHSPRREGLSNYLYRLPIIVPHTIAVLLVLNILSNSGLMPRLLYALGMPGAENAFPGMVFDRAGIGVILTYLWKGTPFATFMVYTILKNSNPGLFEAALNLGASKWKAFFYVVLPLLKPAIIPSFLFLFAYAFGSWEVPYLIGPTYPRALPVLAYTFYVSPELSARPYAMAVNMVMMAVSFILIYIYSRQTARAGW
ncbi:ABC transporter permease [Thermosediminibacter litoriperuensis]|uniref:Putative spermidine/putrescine transport system permease protein n=1 Tax=Thermosediminibacter litoriperuensis TaxID=291989 RepID=A0A5S5AEE0_9FIRM|nr:sugar ABC transporter permease [Thermosediminibacter litoriperuensis]TYP48410.1 putative spermidine/putrescine transport system permease protein [Thermosediminibacter litoriperuensis]